MLSPAQILCKVEGGQNEACLGSIRNWKNLKNKQANQFLMFKCLTERISAWSFLQTFNFLKCGFIL